LDGAQRSGTVQTDEMSSAYRPPDPKKQISGRVRGSIHTKLEAVRRIWQARAKATGVDAEEVDLTYVLDALLDKATDDELQQWGGLPTTEAGWREVLKQVADASKQ
jgi:hypothetical protein